MTNKLKIGFAYADLCLANLMDMIFRTTDVDKHARIAEAVKLAERMGITTTEEAIAQAFTFVSRKQLVYATVSPLWQLVQNLLENDDFFPENIEDFASILTGGVEGLTLTKDQSQLLTAHEELLTFWKAYSLHVNAYESLVCTLQAYGAIHTAVFSDAEYPCLYHRGMVDVSSDVQRIVDLYAWYKDHLGFTPAMLSPVELELPEVTTLLFDVSTSEIKVNAPTLGGRIWFEGTPDDTAPGGISLKGK